MTFTDDPSRDYERFCDAQDHGAGDDYEPPEGGDEPVKAVDRGPWRLYAFGLESGAYAEDVDYVHEHREEGEDTLGRLEGRIAKEEALKRALNAPPDNFWSSELEKEQQKDRCQKRQRERSGEAFAEANREAFTRDCDTSLGEEVVYPPEVGYASLAAAERAEDEALCDMESELTVFLLRRGAERGNADPRGKFWDGGEPEPVRHEELYREDLEAPGEEF